jgi:hypothetical protein
MHAAVIAYRGAKLEANERNDVWTVRLANLETRASYLDLALAELLGNAPEAHRAAARLLAELAEVVEQQEAGKDVARAQPPARSRPLRRRASTKPLLVGLRVFVFAALASTAFMFTTWLTTLR